MIDLHLDDILNKTTNDPSLDVRIQMATTIKPFPHYQINVKDNSIYTVTSDRIPDELFIGTESLYISEEGIISNLIEWFRKKQKERAERRRAQQRQNWQNGINRTFEGYYDWLNSLDPKRLAEKETDPYKYEDIQALVLATTKVTQGFVGIDPLKHTSMVKLLTTIRTILNGQKNFYLDKNDDLTFDPRVARPVVKFKSSKWSSEQAVKRMQSIVLQMDDISWKLDDAGNRVVNEYNTKLRTSNDSTVRDIRKCAVCWLNFSDLVVRQEINTVRAICSTLNNM